MGALDRSGSTKGVPFYAQGNPEYWGWTVAIALGVISLFLSFTLLWTGRVQRKRQTPIILPDGTEQAPLVAHGHHPVDAPGKAARRGTIRCRHWALRGPFS